MPGAAHPLPSLQSRVSLQPPGYFSPASAAGWGGVGGVRGVPSGAGTRSPDQPSQISVLPSVHGGRWSREGSWVFGKSLFL